VHRSRMVLLTLVFLACGCVSGTPAAQRSEIEEIKARQAAARLRLDALQRDIAAAEDRARLAKAAADFENCQAHAAKLRGDVAVQQAQCLQSIAAYNVCVAENEKKTASSGTAGCLLGILVAGATGGLGIPWGIGGCAAGLTVGAATGKACNFQPCEVNAEKLEAVSLARAGLSEWPRCGGYVGISVAALPGVAPGGLEVVGVGPGTTAQELGLAPHDVLVRVRGIDTVDVASLDLALAPLVAGDSVEVDVIRDSRKVRTRGTARLIDAWGCYRARLLT